MLIERTERIKETDDDNYIGTVSMSADTCSQIYPPEQFLDTKTIIRYFAVNRFLISHDSYTGRMLHNYLL